jgi:hypothetical protein
MQQVQRALPKQLHFLSKPAALGGGLIGGVCGLGVFGLAGLGILRLRSLFLSLFVIHSSHIYHVTSHGWVGWCWSLN